MAFRRADLLAREQGQMLVRIALTVLIIGYFAVSHYPLNFDRDAPAWLFLLAYLLFAVVVAFLALHDRQSRGYRRLATNVIDIVATSYMMVSTGEAGTPFFAIYLWITLGNGFRFGLSAMAISAILSIAGFSYVMLTVDPWRQHISLSSGVLIALIVLPAYAAHLIRQLHKARRRAEEASIAKSQFLARMSHELRTPLNGVMGTADLLRNNHRLTTTDRELIGVIQESVGVSLRQIDNVLDFARIEAGKLVLEQAEFDLHRILQSVVRMVSPAAREKNLRLLLRISPQAPYRLIGDMHHLREILLNLVSNAIKFTQSGYVALQVEPISVTESSTRLRFEIRDTGIGIATEALGRIWESFTQEDTGTTRSYGGAGLGTTIAKQLAELMGGKIAVSSIKGRGAVFWCDLPFKLSSDSGLTEVSIANARVLVLTTDHDKLQHLQQTVAQMHGTLQSTATVADTIAALTRGIRLSHPWHMVLVDEKMVIAPGNQHRADDLAAKALIAQTPLYLLSATAHEIEQLCEWGYAGLLPPLPAMPALTNAIHASPQYDVPADNASSVLQVEPWAWGRAAKTGARLLVADDNRINRLILEQVLESAGYELDIVNDGETALRRLTTRRYQAAVLDLHMPGLDGDDLLRRYRLLKAGARIPIIMLTADVTFNAKSDCADAGADAFLTKPVSADSLLSTLERLIQERQVHNLPLQADMADDPLADSDTPALDVSVLAELDHLCRNPARFIAVIETFESEGETLLANMAEAVATHNHTTFKENLHALKGNAMNVGALQLMDTCKRIEAAGVLDFRLRGEQRVRELGEQLVSTQQALRALCPPHAQPGQSGNF